MTMGVAGLLTLAVLRPTGLPPPSAWILPLADAGGCCLAGQAGLFYALQRVESSRISPLLGMKIVFLAALAVAFAGQRLGPQQWLAVGLCAAASWLLNEAGGRIPARCAVALFFTILGAMILLS
jgi:drug/metabolite transporter (DMT)-like permease